MSQADRILLHLKSGHPLTPLEALEHYGVGRLAARVHELRAMGHNIVAEQVEVQTRGGAAKVARYSLAVADGNLFPGLS